MKHHTGFKWSIIGIMLFTVSMIMNADQKTKEQSNEQSLIPPGFYNQWASYDDLTNWVQNAFPNERLIYFDGQRRQMAVLFLHWPTGVSRTHFIAFCRHGGQWKVLLVHNIVENESLTAEKKADGLHITTKAGKVLLVLPG